MMLPKMAAMRFLLLLLCSFSTIEFSATDVPPYTELYFDQTIDHFNFKSFGDLTYRQRYLIQDKWWSKGKGPIFFYTGNEGDITDFWSATGFVHEFAPVIGAFVVFAEHRYYGKSLPFGDKSFTDPYIGYLTVEQALADYAVLISSLKTSLNASSVPVVCFGGSYGGMLSAYMRFKYPNIVTASLAASAPIYMLDPNTDESFFFNHVTYDFLQASGECVASVRSGFDAMDKLAQTGSQGLATLTSDFQLCSPLADAGPSYRHLLLWLRNAFTYIAMLDYPYPVDFLGLKLPAFPVKAACDAILNATDPLRGLAAAAGIFYNVHAYTPPCFNITADFVECADPTGCGTGSNALAWDYQACTELRLPDGSNGRTDMFPSLPFTPEMRNTYCKQRWGVLPRDQWSAVNFWGTKINASSNIIFSNGDLDPWYGGGVTDSLSQSLVAVLVKGGAHHLDLRGNNPLDPAGVIEAREKEREYIYLWVNSVMKP